MTIPHYSVLKGKIIDTDFNQNGEHEHYIINIEDSNKKYKAFINVLSYEGESYLESVLDANWKNPLKDKLDELELGLHAVQSQPNGLAIDFKRSKVVNPNLFTGVPTDIEISDSKLAKLIDHFVDDSKSENESKVYVYGSAFGHNGEDLGIHDVHMNQGNSGHFKKDNGVYQDGALLFQYSKDEPWVALFLKFQSQTLDTDDENGNPNQ